MEANIKKETQEDVAKLIKTPDINNTFYHEFDDLLIETANETHKKEIAELWANLAAIQQIVLPERYSFKGHSKQWYLLVEQKLTKKHHLLLSAHIKNQDEIKGFLYLQTVTLPSSNLILKCMIEDLYTKPQYRKQGIATKLLNCALEWVEKMNIRHVDLISTTKSRDLSFFYLNYLKVFNGNIKAELITL